MIASQSLQALAAPGMAGAMPVASEIVVNDIAPVEAADRAILVLTRSMCGACAAYMAQIQALQARGALAGFTVGKMVLDLPGQIGFKRENEWLAEVDAIPYTVLYQQGRQIDRFAASKASYLLERIEDAYAGSLSPSPAPASMLRAA